MKWDTIPGQPPPHVPTDRITVLTGSKGKHLFERIRDRRVALVDASASEAPDLVVFACGTDKHFDFMTSTTLAPALLAHLAEGRTGVVFDASTEGARHTPERTGRLHALLAQWRVPAQRAVYLTEDRGYGDEYRAHCRAIGAPPMTVLNHDYWLWRSVDVYGDDREQIYVRRLAAFRARPRRRGRRYLSLNRTIRPHKTVFLLRILRDRLWDAGYVSFGGFLKPGDRIGKPRPTPEQLVAALPGFEDLIAELAPQLDTLEAKGQVLLGMQRHDWTQLEVTKAILAVDLAEYDDCWFSLVTETDFRARVFRVTEKVLKPFVNFHPMLVLGNPGELRMARDLGFATFEDVFDESYDEEPDQRRRFEHVYAQFSRWCRADEDDLAHLSARVEEKLIFNARWGITRFPGMYRVQYDTSLVNNMLAAVEGRYRSS